MLDLQPIRERSDRYMSIADRMDGNGRLPNLSSTGTASAIGLSASLTAADVPDLLTEIDRLRSANDAVLRHSKAALGGTDQLLADLRTILRQLLEVDVCARCRSGVTKAVRDVGPLIGQAETLLQPAGAVDA